MDVKELIWCIWSTREDNHINYAYKLNLKLKDKSINIITDGNVFELILCKWPPVKISLIYLTTLCTNRGQWNVTYYRDSQVVYPNKSNF